MKILPLKPFYNVAANQQAQLLTQELGTMYSLHALHFVLGGGDTNANTSQIYVKFAKQDLINIQSNAGSALSAGQMLQAINTWKGTGAGTAGYLTLFLGDPEMADNRHRHLGDLDLSVHRESDGAAGVLEIYHTLGAGANPTLTAWAEVEPPKALRGFSANDSQVHRVYLRSTPPVASALNNSQLDLDVGAAVKGKIQAEYWFSGHLTSLEIKRANVELWQNLPTALVTALQAYQGHVATAGLYVWSPTYQGDITKSVDSLLPDETTGAAFNHLATTSAADTIDVYTAVTGNRYLSAVQTGGGNVVKKAA